MLKRVNRRVTRLVYLLYYKYWRQQDISPIALLKELGCQQLNERRRYHCLVQLYKILNQHVAIPPTLPKSLVRTLRVHSKNTKQKEPPVRGETVRNYFFPKIIPEWKDFQIM